MKKLCRKKKLCPRDPEDREDQEEHEVQFQEQNRREVILSLKLNMVILLEEIEVI